MELEVFTGCMFSGKTTRLLTSLRHRRIAGYFSVLISPNTDSRFVPSKITHDDQDLLQKSVDLYKVIDAARPHELSLIVEEVSGAKNVVIGIDEAQFLVGKEWIKVIEEILSEDKAVKRIYCAFLNQTFAGMPFGLAPDLLAIADRVTHLTAVCRGCGGEASKTKRLVASDENVLVGGSNEYTPRCRSCWTKGI